MANYERKLVKVYNPDLRFRREGLIPTRADYQDILRSVTTPHDRAPLPQPTDLVVRRLNGLASWYGGEKGSSIQGFAESQDLAILLSHVRSPSGDRKYDNDIQLKSYIHECLVSQFRMRWAQPNEVVIPPYLTYKLYQVLRIAGELPFRARNPDFYLLRFGDEGLSIEANECTLASVGSKIVQINYFLSGNAAKDIFGDRSKEWKRFLTDAIRFLNPSIPDLSSLPLGSSEVMIGLNQNNPHAIPEELADNISYLPFTNRTVKEIEEAIVQAA